MKYRIAVQKLEKSSANWQVVQVAVPETSPVVMVALKPLPPTIWWTWDEGIIPGLTRGSSRSMTTCEHPNRSMVSPPAPPPWGAASARATRARSEVQNIVTFGGALSTLLSQVASAASRVDVEGMDGLLESG